LIYEPTDVAAKIARKEQSKRDAISRDTEERDDWLWLMGMTSGRRLWNRICVEFKADEKVFNSNNSVMSCQAGLRDWVADKRRFLRRICPELLAQALVEQAEAEQRSAE